MSVGKKWGHGFCSPCSWDSSFPIGLVKNPSHRPDQCTVNVGSFEAKMQISSLNPPNLLEIDFSTILATVEVESHLDE
jgi:hypothetical protein